jgi:hypothetical protein
MMDYKKILQNELNHTDVCDMDTYDGQVNKGIVPPDDCEFLKKHTK